MTTVTIKKSSDEIYKGLEVKGHAGFAESGKDIVCAAVSVLTINLVNSLEEFTDDPFKGSMDEKKGIIKLDFSETPSKEAELLLKSYELGINGIFSEYGKDFLNIKIRRV